MWVIYDAKRHEVVGKHFTKAAAKDAIWWRSDIKNLSLEKVASPGCKGLPSFDEWWTFKTLAYTKPIDLR